MAKSRSELSVADLQRMLERKQSRLAALLKKRQSLQKTLATVEKQIAALEGSKSRSGTQKRRRKPGRRVKNARPLHVVVTEILSKTKAGLKVADLAEKVAATGYKSKSANFKNVVHQTLYNSDNIVRDKQTGKYRMK